MKYLVLLLLIAGTGAPLLASASSAANPETELRRNKKSIKYRVKPGESLSSILKTYSLDLEAFLKENPEVAAAKGVLKVDQTVYIPQLFIGTTSDAQIDHQIKVFLTAAAEQKEAETPAEIIVPADRKKDTTVPEARLSTAGEYLMHHVKPRETLYSISRTYGVTVDDIIRLNPEVGERGLKKDTDIRIKRLVEQRIDPAELRGPGPVIFSQPEAEPMDRVNVAMLLPVSGDIFTTESLSVNDRNYLSFYRGALVALDSLKRMGMQIKLDTYKCGRDSAQVHSLIASGALERADLIIGPVYEEPFHSVAPYAYVRRIPMVSPLAVVSDNMPNVFQVAPVDSTRYDKLKGSFAGKRVIFVTSGNDDAEFMAAMHRMAAAEPNAGISEFRYDRTLKPEAIGARMDKQKDNVFVVGAKDNLMIGMIASSLVSVRNLMPYISFSAIGSPAFAKVSRQERNDFFKADVRYVTSYHQDRSDNASLAFETEYIRDFNDRPSLFAYRGYDVTLIFLSLMKEYGRGFPQYIDGYIFEPLQVKYTFEQPSDGEKFINTQWSLVRYAPSFRILSE